MANVWAIVTALGILLLALASLLTLTLLYAQARVLRRAAMGPLLHELLREYQSLRGGVDALARPGPLGPAGTAEIEQILDFFARLEQLIAVGALEPVVAMRAFGDNVNAVLDDERVREELVGKGRGRFADAVAIHQRFGGASRAE